MAQAAGFGFRSLLNAFREKLLGRDGREGLACRLPDEAAAVLDARAAALRLGLPRRLNAPTRQTVLLLLNSTSDLVDTFARPLDPRSFQAKRRACQGFVVAASFGQTKPRGFEAKRKACGTVKEAHAFGWLLAWRSACFCCFLEGGSTSRMIVK